MKRYMRFVCGLLVLAALLCCTVMPVWATAQADTQERTVQVQIHVQSGADVAKNEYVDVYFQNTATNELHKFTLKAGTDRNPVKLPMGEYRIEKAVLTDRPEVAFETSLGKLTVDDSENIFFQMSLKKAIAAEGNDDLTDQIIKEHQLEKNNNFFIAVGMLVWLALMGVSVAYTIRSNLKKNQIKSEFLKAKGKIMRHVLIGLLIGFCTGMLFGGKSGISWIAVAIGFGVPFGISAASRFFMAGEDDQDRDRDREDSSGGATIVFAMAVAAVIGVVLAPIVLVRDVIDIVKAYRSYKSVAR